MQQKKQTAPKWIPKMRLPIPTTSPAIPALKNDFKSKDVVVDNKYESPKVKS